MDLKQDLLSGCYRSFHLVVPVIVIFSLQRGINLIVGLVELG